MRFALRYSTDPRQFGGSHCFEFTVRSRRSPEQTFDFLVDLSRESEWFPDFEDGAWQTPEPHGVGARRWFQTDIIWLQEQFVVWERGLRLMFVATETSLPLMRDFAEDYRLEPQPDGGCLVRWSIAYTPASPASDAAPLLRSSV